MLTVKSFAFATLALLAAVPANGTMPMHSSNSTAVVMQVDWQAPLQLPPRFRNHCAVETFTGRPYCSDHCGGDYQFYYCSQTSFGCCHLGHGYCAWNGLLRCTP
jgi:hypothetical protein